VGFGFKVSGLSEINEKLLGCSKIKILRKFGEDKSSTLFKEKKALGRKTDQGREKVKLKRLANCFTLSLN